MRLFLIFVLPFFCNTAFATGRVSSKTFETREAAFTVDTWDIGKLDEVKMFVQNTNHYALDTEEGAAEWAALFPSDGGIIRPSGRAEPLTISMYHQLRCLDNIRVAVVQAIQNVTVPGPVTIHCMNYIRQMVLCRSDLYLESVRDPDALHAVNMMGERTCKDWTKVYATTAG